ncbi:hypothetical protein JCM8547_007949 [Rhodosporidiobolus lusitaniae]
MHLTPTALLLALVSPLISASHSSSLPPRRHHRPIPLPLRLHHSLKDSYAHGRIHLSKRAAVDDLFCGIGVLSSCPDSGSGGSSSSPGIDTDSDVNNCGRLGFVCPSPFANGIGTALCQAGTCVTSCPTGYTYTTAGCLDTRSDPSNCGSVGKTCPSSYDNGTGSTCSEGLCGPLYHDLQYKFSSLLDYDYDHNHHFQHFVRRINLFVLGFINFFLFFSRRIELFLHSHRRTFIYHDHPR